VRRLWNEGKFDEAFQRAFGRIPEEQLNSKGWAAWRAESKKQRAEVQAKVSEVERQKAELRDIHGRLMAEYQTMHDARKALQDGDLDAAFQKFAGVDFNTFSRNHLRQSTAPSVGKDPAFQALQRELAEVRRENQEHRQRMQEQASQAQKERAQREYVADMIDTLEASDDQRIVKAARRPKFQQKIIEIQQQHWDPTTEWTLPHEEAAQMALQELESEWGEVFGGSASRPEPRGESRTQPARAATPAKPTARAVTTLSQKEAAEAATQPKLKGKALVEKYVAQANAMLLKQNGIG
jgi:hypothetical protein